MADIGLRAAPAYRPDIDGLRAVAVVSVILFHAHVPGTGGGYVGVDVFFVISGYLITQLLVGSDATRPRVPLSEFYLRRARRILPALYLAALVVGVAAAFIYLPWHVWRTGKYLFATPLFASNVPAWREGGGYFAVNSGYVALTHFWSIAVEEQFYFLYPVTLLLIGQYLPRCRWLALASLAGVSLVLCVWASYGHAIANYYLAPPRAWELLLGALLATGAELRIRPRIANELVAAVAILTLLLTVCSYGPLTRYPGVYTIPPCAAAGLLIATGRQQPTLVSRLLAWRPLVFTGLISYSLYLWHLPVLIFAQYYNIRPLGAARTGLLLVCLYLLAAGSWKLIEKPFRYRAVLKSDRAFVLSACACGALICAFGLVLWRTNLPARTFPGNPRAPDLSWLTNSGRMPKCVNRSVEAIVSGDLCSYGPQDPRAPRAVVWGDSHAMAALPAYEKLAVEYHVQTYFAVRPACRPLLGVTNRTDSEDRQIGCKDFNTAVAGAIRQLDPRVVILNAHWIDPDVDLVLPAGLDAEPGESHFRRGLEQTLQEIRAPHRRVCVVLDVPTYQYDVPYALGMASKRGIAVDFLTVSRAAGLAQYRAPEREFHLLQARGLLTTVDPKELLCRGDSCAYEADGNLLYADEQHLSVKGALLISSALQGCFRGLSAVEPR